MIAVRPTGAPPSPLPPSLARLEDELRRAETELSCADIGIANEFRRRAEMERWRGRVDFIKGQIARLRETY